MNKQRIEKLWAELRRREGNVREREDMIELLEALLDEGEQPDHSVDTSTVA